MKSGANPSPLGRATSSPATAPAAPAATQRICCRSTPREERNRRTTQTAAGGRLNQCSRTPTMVSTAATSPAGPASPSGLSIPSSSTGPGARAPPTMARTNAGHAGDHDQAPATRAQLAVGQQEGRQGDAEPDRGRPAQGTGRRDELGDERQGPVLAEQLVDPGPQGEGVGPGEAGGPVQPADRVARPPQGQHQPDGGEPEHEEERVHRALDQHGDGEGPVDGQGDQQPGGAAAEGDQPQRPGEHHHGPGPQAPPPPPLLPPRSGAVRDSLHRLRYGSVTGTPVAGPDCHRLPVTLGQRSNRFPED